MAFFGGGYKTYDVGADPTFERMNEGLYGFSPRKGFALKRDKQNLRAMDAGEDVSSLGFLNSIRQQAAAERRDIGDNFMYGQNALLMNAGGEQANLVNRGREIALEESREREGRNMVDATAQLRESMAGRLHDWNKFRQGAMLDARSQAAGNQLGFYRSRYMPYQDQGFLGKLSQIANFAGGVAGSVTGLKGAFGGGSSLPVRPSFPISQIPGSGYPR